MAVNAKQSLDDVDDVSTAARTRAELDSEWLIERMPGLAYRCEADEHLSMRALTQGVAELLGYPASDLVANARRSWASVVHPEDRARVCAQLQRVLASRASQPAQLEYRVVRADGELRWVQQKAWVVDDGVGHSASLEGFIFDVTEHHMLQAAEVERLAAYDRQQRALVALATNAAIAEGSVGELASLATELMVGAIGVERASVWLMEPSRTQLELIDLYCCSRATHERGSTLAVAEHPAYFAALDSGRALDAHDALTDPRTADFADSYLRPLDIVGMLDAAIRLGGELVGVVCLEQVGEARRWQRHEIEFASEVADQLSLALHNRARLDGQAREQHLQEQLLHAQKMDALGRLAGGVAHDFNNLLMIIGASAELLDMSLADPTLRSSAQDIIAATHRAGTLTEQLRAFSRQEPLERYSFDLARTVAELEPFLRRMVGRGARLECTVPSAPVHVSATEGLIRQALTNLVVNARDAIRHDFDHPGEVEVILDVVEFGETVVDLPEAVPVGTYASLCVSDDGAGMSPEVRAQAFEPFFTTKALSEGTGLGLATVYAIARRCGGMVKLTSEPGAGTQVYLLLPLALAPDPA